ncbi:hypothetical protein ACFQGT_00910 [Natrialbaceae archaeon GCM10025810]
MTNMTGAMGGAERPGTCPHCRTDNDYFFTYCRHCLERLPSRTARRG